MRVEGRLRTVRDAIEHESKSLRWRLRARVGTRLPWRREVEEREGSPIIATVTAGHGEQDEEQPAA